MDWNEPMKKRNLMTCLLCALLLFSTVSCGKQGIKVNQEQIKEQLQIADQKAKESKAAVEESKRIAREESESIRKAEAESKRLQAEKERKDKETETHETKGPVEEVILDKTDYTAPKFTPEVYDPASDTRALKVWGLSYSDGDYAVCFGQCAVGATVTLENEEGKFSVQSAGGTFMLRFYSPLVLAEITVTQSYNGEQIGKPVQYKGEIVQTDFGDAWSALAADGYQGFFHKMLPDYMGTNLLDDATLADVTERYRGRVEKLATQVGDGCELICVLVPSSMTTYPEMVPDIYKKTTGKTKFDQTKAALEAAGVTVIDMRESFNAHKNDSLPLYYRQDSHWADYGAYLAYVELFDYISDRYPAATPRKFNEFEWEWKYYTGGDMAYYFGMDEVEGGTCFEYTYQRFMNFDAPQQMSGIQRYKRKNSMGYSSYGDVIVNGGMFKTERPELPDVFVYRNSYGAQMFDIIAERSNTSFFNPTFTYAFNLAQIAKTAPDYVIYIMSEWDFDNLLYN